MRASDEAGTLTRSAASPSRSGSKVPPRRAMSAVTAANCSAEDRRDRGEIGEKGGGDHPHGCPYPTPPPGPSPLLGGRGEIS